MSQPALHPTTAAIREVAHAFDGRATEDGGGVKLIRVFDPRTVQLTDPFLLFDEFRSDNPDDYLAGFPPHPHRGFETVTYMMAGHMRHGDNQGKRGDLGPGAVQWMTAARGIVHEERPQQENGLMWGYQLWVNLPARDKMGAPVYQDIPSEQILETTLPGGGRLRVLAGDYEGIRSVVRPRPSEPFYFDINLPAQAEFRWTPPAGHRVMLHGVAGEFSVGDAATTVRARRLVVLSAEGDVLVRSGDVPAQLLLIAGKPFGEPVAHYGPFVMTTQEEIRTAIRDYQDGRF